MASGPTSPLMRFIRKLAARPAGAPSDGELLQQFAAGRDESAFAALVQRHGAMVLNVCRNVLGDADDADDVFQATFLVLVRKARSVGKPESVASWLHGVAYRLAVRARADAARRRARERQAPSMATTEPDSAAVWRDLRPVLNEEVDRLPERYRAPFVLCYLEGKTNDEAAALLGWPKGTVLSSLSRAREKLRERLTRRGIALSSAALASVLTQHAAQGAVPAALVTTTVHAATALAAGAAGGVPAAVLAQADGMVKAMAVARLKTAAVLLLALGTTGAGAGALVVHYRDSGPAASREAAVPPPSSPTSIPPKPSKTERELLRGTWIVTAAEQNRAAAEPLKGTRLVITGDDFVVTAPRGEVRWIFRRGETRGTWQFDSNERPKYLILNDRTRALYCLLRVEDDKLTLCVGDPDVRERPPEFVTSPDDRRLLLVFRRDGKAPER